LNLLGTRETDIYGSQNFDSYLDSLKSSFSESTIDYFQSDIEGEIINFIHESKDSDGIILNAAAYTHTSVGIADAVKSIDCRVVEVHISNTYSREEFRHNSFLSPVVNGIIIGFGLDSYRLALESLIN
jgi:3-dehydroquinate dehydratase-2